MQSGRYSRLDRAGRQHHRRRPDLPESRAPPGLHEGQGHRAGRRLRGQEDRHLGLRQRVGDLRRHEPPR